MSNQPQIDPTWVIAMIACGGIGVIIHIVITFQTLPLLFSNKMPKGKILISGCILVFIFNGIACLIWSLFRTNIFISISIMSCRFIYVTNFLMYFIAKYMLHCVLIGRTYLAFVGTPFRIKSNLMKIYVIIITVNFFSSIFFWTKGVFPNVLKGTWMDYSICTLFSENAANTFAVKLCAILIGAEDFTVGFITLYIILNRFTKIGQTSHSAPLVHLSVRYGIVACIAMTSTLFLFTLAIPFWPNVTFIIPIDAVVNSLCIFCVLTVGSKVYSILCFPFKMCENYFIDDEKNVKIIIHPLHDEPHAINEGKNTSNKKKSTSDEVVLQAHIKLQAHYSEPLNVESLKNEMKRQRFNGVSNPNPYV